MFKKGDTAFIVENGQTVTKVSILRYSSGFYLIQLHSATIRVRASRLFSTESEAIIQSPHYIIPPQKKNQYDYMREIL